MCRVFRNQTQTSVHKYLVRIRLAAALEHLVEYPGADLATLALDLGFSSHSHLTQAFRQTFRVTPSQFQRGATERLFRGLQTELSS